MGETAYIADAGRLAVFKGGTQVAELSEGDCFGEIALLSNALGGPRRSLPDSL